MNKQEEGGGASLTTEPALGTSTATDVSLDRFLSIEIRWVDRFYQAEIRHVKELLEAQRTADQLAVKIALENQKELSEKHNDLIRSGEKKDETYATKVDVNRIAKTQAMMVGGLIVVSSIGLTTLVKLFGG